MPDETTATPVKERTSRWIALKGILRTLGISAPTVWESMAGKLHKPTIDARFQNYCQAVLDDADVKLTIEGAENMQPGAIYMSNHSSLYDIPVIGAVVPGVRMVTKAELFKVPVWGQALEASGFVSIDRRNRDSAIASLKKAAERMRSGVNVWIAPEGTRSRSGQLQEFKKGGFMMAIETGATVIPVTIRGTFEILRPKTASVRLGRAVTLQFHPPIDASRYTVDDRAALMADVRTAISGEPVAPPPGQGQPQVPPPDQV